MNTDCPIDLKTAPLPSQEWAPPAEASSPKRQWWRNANNLYWAALIFVAALGMAVRIYPSAKFDGLGYDENLYRLYVNEVRLAGLAAYPDITEDYIVEQSRMPAAILPPTRFLYIFCSYAWQSVLGGSTLHALRCVSCLFSILTLALTWVFIDRLAGRRPALAVLALMAFAPTQIHMAQHALIDGFFAFWGLLALWTLWENLRAPNHSGWLALYTGALALMVLTKENAFFIYLALLGLLALNMKLAFGKATPRLLLLTVAGPLLGVVILICLAGGLGNFVGVYRLLVAKAEVLPYAIRTGDGPWYRYLVDLLLMSPLTLLLAIGAVFQLRRADKAALYLLAFVVLCYIPMANVKYGMNLRYATIWDLPLRYLAFLPLANWTQLGGRRAGLYLAAGIALLCAFDFHQYVIFFVNNPLYELASEGLLHVLKIVK